MPQKSRKELSRTTVLAEWKTLRQVSDYRGGILALLSNKTENNSVSSMSFVNKNNLNIFNITQFLNKLL